jgi:hypothetical protein
MHNDTVMVHAMIIVVLATDNDEKDLDIFYIFMKYMILIDNVVRRPLAPQYAQVN